MGIIIFCIVGIFVCIGIVMQNTTPERKNNPIVKNRTLLFTALGFLGLMILVISLIDSKERREGVKQGVEKIACWRCAKDLTNSGAYVLVDGKYECNSCNEETTKKEIEISKPIVKKIPSDPYKGITCLNCSFGKYYEGFCNVCGAASPGKIMEHRRNMRDCGLCGGDGIESNSFGESRICPMCNGSGKTKY